MHPSFPFLMDHMNKQATTRDNDHPKELRPRSSELPTKTSELSSKLFEQPGKPLSLLRSLVASIATKNGATTTATTIIMTGQKARGPGNFIATDQIFVQR
jgi:hypothetical protein